MAHWMPVVVGSDVQHCHRLMCVEPFSQGVGLNLFGHHSIRRAFWAYPLLRPVRVDGAVYGSEAGSGVPDSLLARGVDRSRGGSVSAIRVADTAPDTKVSAAMTHIAACSPNASAVIPASSAPIAYPRSRQRR